MDIILHLGAHRTASTLLQKTFGANGLLLAQNGVQYWGPKVTRRGLFDDLFALPGDLGVAATTAASLRIARRVREADREGARTLVVSDENMLGTMQELLSGADLYPEAARRVAMLARFFAGHRLTLALAIRSPETWWPSVRAFRAMRAVAVPNADDLANMAVHARTWRAVIEDLAQAAPMARLRVWCHEEMANRPQDTIAHLTGVDIARGDLDRHRNAGSDALRVTFEARVRGELQERYADDLAWLHAGADGWADVLNAGPRDIIPAGTGEERGRPDDGHLQDTQRLA